MPEDEFWRRPRAPRPLYFFLFCFVLFCFVLFCFVSFVLVCMRASLAAASSSAAFFVPLILFYFILFYFILFYGIEFYFSMPEDEFGGGLELRGLLRPNLRHMHQCQKRPTRPAKETHLTGTRDVLGWQKRPI